MATKDWKILDNKKYIISWIYKKGKRTNAGFPTIVYKDIFIIKYTGDENWTFVDRAFNTSNKSFTSKSQALSFTKQYMRTH